MDLKGEIYKKQEYEDNQHSSDVNTVSKSDFNEEFNNDNHDDEEEYEDNYEKETEREMDENVTQNYRMETKELSPKRIKLDVDIESPLMPNNNRVNI